MNIEGHRARWNTGDGTPHSDYVLTMFRYANKQTNPEVVEMYVERLNYIPLEELKAVWESLQPTDQVKPIVPSVEALKKTHAVRKKRQLERSEQAKEKRKKATFGEKDVAKQAANSAYANRIMKHIGLLVPITPPKYFGDFDYKSVAEQAPLPDPDDTDHKPYWQQMRSIFDKAWEEYL